MNAPAGRDYLGKALDIAIRLAVIGVIVLGSYRIFSPFMLAVVWAIVIAITLHPVFNRMRNAFGGKSKLAGAAFIVLSLALVITPVVWLTDSLLDATVGIIKQAQSGTLDIPPPTEKVKDWPLIGDRAYELWHVASVDLEGTMDKLQPQLRNFGERVVSSVASLGGSLIQTIFALIIAGILMMTSEGGARTARSIAKRLAGDDGPPMVDLTIGTIRSVVKGVVIVSLIQGLMAAIGLVIAGVPGAGLWALLVMMVAVMQLPPLLILGPIIAWVFANNDSTALAIFFTIWSILVNVADGILKPILLGRGVRVPMLVILIGAIGGMLRAGIVGLFVGPVMLAIFYQLFVSWVRDDDAPAGPAPEPETGATG